MRRTAILFSIVVLLTPVAAQTQDTELVVDRGRQDGRVILPLPLE